VTKLLKQALAEVEKLPAPEQDAIASLILDEVVDEQRWDEAFAQSQEQLGKLAEKVRADIRSGKVADMGIDEL
jgi:hypothetical protein